MKPCPDRVDLETSVLFMLDKCFQIVTDNLLDTALPYASIETQKGACRMQAALKSAWLVVHPPLVAHVHLDVFFAGNLHLGDLLKETIKGRLYRVAKIY